MHSSKSENRTSRNLGDSLDSGFIPERIEASPYALIRRADGSLQSGTLLRVVFPDVGVGYADLHPWPSLGDPSVEDHLSALRTGRVIGLAGWALFWAKEDARARSEQRSLLPREVDDSHLSAPFDQASDSIVTARQEGFATVKVKTSDGAEINARQWAESGLRLRIDFNQRSSYEAIARSLQRWQAESGDLKWIDFLEDPFLADPHDWTRLRDEFSIALAADFATFPGSVKRQPYDFRVWKPAAEGPRPHHEPVVVTSYLDHPLGQCVAASQATTGGIAGLLTHRVYEPTAYSDRLTPNGPFFQSPGGTGFGFDDLLEAEPWQRIC